MSVINITRSRSSALKVILVRCSILMRCFEVDASFGVALAKKTSTRFSNIIPNSIRCVQKHKAQHLQFRKLRWPPLNMSWHHLLFHDERSFGNILQEIPVSQVRGTRYEIWWILKPHDLAPLSPHFQWYNVGPTDVTYMLGITCLQHMVKNVYKYVVAPFTVS